MQMRDGQLPVASTKSVGVLMDEYLATLKPLEEIQREMRGHRQRFSTKVPRSIIASSMKGNPFFLSLDSVTGGRNTVKALADKRRRLAARNRRMKRRMSEKSLSGADVIVKGLKRDQKKAQAGGSGAKQQVVDKRKMSKPVVSPVLGSSRAKRNLAKERRKRQRRDRKHLIRSSKKNHRVPRLLAWCPRRQIPMFQTQRGHPPLCNRRRNTACQRPTPVPDDLFIALSLFSNDAVALRSLYVRRYLNAFQQQQLTADEQRNASPKAADHKRVSVSSPHTKISAAPHPPLMLPVFGLRVQLVEVVIQTAHVCCATTNDDVDGGRRRLQHSTSFQTLVETAVILYECNNILAGFSQGSFLSRRKQRAALQKNSSDPAVEVEQGTRTPRSGVVVRAERYFPGSCGTRADLVHNLCLQELLPSNRHKGDPESKSRQDRRVGHGIITAVFFETISDGMQQQGEGGGKSRVL